ncbi:MAG: hypothetical protein ACRD1V_17930 [Vicinamibacterales bacterium]
MAKHRQLKTEPDADPGSQLDALLRALGRIEHAIDDLHQTVRAERDALNAIEARMARVSG